MWTSLERQNPGPTVAAIPQPVLIPLCWACPNSWQGCQRRKTGRIFLEQKKASANMDFRPETILNLSFNLSLSLSLNLSLNHLKWLIAHSQISSAPQAHQSSHPWCWSTPGNGARKGRIFPHLCKSATRLTLQRLPNIKHELVYQFINHLPIQNKPHTKNICLYIYIYPH